MFIYDGKRCGFPPIEIERGMEPMVLAMAGKGFEVRRVSYCID